MENPKCPYCGKTMALQLRHGYFSYFCPSCYSEAPIRTTTEEALAAAMKRDGAKGEWIERIDEYPDGNVASVYYYCSNCEAWGYNDYNFCPNCGAEMREEANDER